MQSTSIIRRWIRGSLLITVLVLVLAEGLFLYYSYNDLYGGVERAVENRFSTVVGRLQATGTAGDTANTAESRANVLRRVVEQFDEKDKFEFMLLDTQGVILATSSGTMNRDLTNGTDYGRALTSANGIGSAIFTTPQGERVMAITMLVPYAAGSIAAMRMVTSLTLVDGLWWRTVAICVGLGVLVLAFTVWSGLFFVRSIVRPLGEVEATATKIAKGDMKVRLPDTRYDDEIGRLCKTINQMAEDLAETERLKNEFISSVSHELRTPLTSIRGWVETISNIDDPTNENYRRGLSIIGTETDRLYTMVEELLDFSRLQNGIKMNCEVLDFVAEATDAALFVEARIRQEGMQLVYSEPPEPYPVWADPARLRQVFVNLFDNAIKYSEPGGTIFLTLSRTPVTVSASIRDQGRGIAPRFFLAGTSAAQQPQHRHGHGFTHVAHADALAAVAQGHLVADLHQHREADGRIEIALGDMVAQTVHEQAQADHHQKAQTQDDDRGVTLHKTCQRRGGHDHDQHGHDDGQHHHRDMVHHAHRGDDGIQGEHGIQHQDLDDDLPEARARGRRGVFGHAAFQALVQLHGPLEQQKDAAAHEDEISPREGFAEDRDQGLGQTDDPGDGGKQHQARDERQTKTGEEGPAALFLRMQARGEDGDENEVVDAQHDLEHDQGAQPGPGRGIGDPREIPHGSFPPPCGSDAEVMPGPPAPHGVPDWMEAAYAGVRQESVGMAGKRAKKRRGRSPSQSLLRHLNLLHPFGYSRFARPHFPGNGTA